MKNYYKNRQNSGITLIALVITIVVLLILAGVSIMTLTGDNGLLTRTTTAKQKTEEAGVIENIRLAYQSAKIGEYAGETGDFATKFQMELAKVYSNPTVTQGENGTYTVGVPEGNFIVNSNGSVEKKSGVLITTKPTKIKKGEKIDLTATLDGVTGNITWETSDSTVISVTSSGRIEGKADSGRATITAKIDEEHKDEFTINIAQKITAISAGEDITLEKNSTGQIVVTTTPNTGTVEDITYTYSSDNTSSVTVDTNGVLTGVATGEATITVTGVATETLTTTFKVTVPKATVTSVKIKDKDGVEQTVTKSDVGSYYGKTVDYTTGGTYRIFYIDFDGDFGEAGTIYLKADWAADDVNLRTEGANTYTPIDTTKLAKMNPSWWSARSTATWNANEKCAAYLCDPTTSESTSNQEWAAYFDSGKADYVIGSPSVEMYIKSYNQVTHTTNNYTLGASYRDDSAVASGYGYNRTQGYIYTLNGAQSTVSSNDYSTGTDTLDYVGYNSMYCGVNGAKGSCYWWLASPSANVSNSVCLVQGLNAYLGNGQYNYTAGVCPLVSLKSKFTPQISE